MGLKQNFALMANYNQWMNGNIYALSANLSTAELNQDRGAFFSSITGTLNHILVSDLIWLRRFTNHPANFSALECVHSLPAPSFLSEIIYPEFDALREARVTVDAAIVNFVTQVSEPDYDYTLAFEDMKGKLLKKKFAYLVHHFFNHQTHHRGQVTTLLNQRGIDAGITDLLIITPNVE